MAVQTKFLRSLLFVPAGKLDKWNRALASGADILCIDLEDSVPDAEKAHARTSVFSFLQHNRSGHSHVIIRINAPGTDAGARDLDMIRELSHSPFGLMIPMLDEAGPLEALAKQLIMFGKKTALFPLIETAQGLENTRNILSCNLVAGAVFGGHDLAMQIGCSKEWDVLAGYRSEFIRGAGGLNLALFDMPWFGLDDSDGLKKETARAKNVGFTGKTAIHPRQIDIIHATFTPSGKEIAEAREKIRLFEENKGHPTVWKGTILEPPVINQAKRVLEKAEYLENPGSKET